MNRESGFTLLEILVVVLIIAVLATIVGVNVAKEPGRARVTAATAQIRVLTNALQLYRMDNGFIPSQQQGLRALCEPPSVPPLAPRYREGGYLETRNLPKDGWGNEYVYLVPGRSGEAYEILSYGADGEPDGQGEAADISSSTL
ncbi:type II secretion system major pseudopilin GspG [Verrucomicrobiota bacterium]